VRRSINNGAAAGDNSRRCPVRGRHHDSQVAEGGKKSNMLEITWLGHGTFLLRLDSGEVVVLDPWVDGNPSYPKNHSFDRIDLMLISHGHFDHIHDAVPLAKKFKPQVVCIYETGQWLQSKGV